MAYVDARRVRQILTNLVGNAIKFTQEGVVRVLVSTEGNYAKLSVRDSGPGISPQERAFIFDDYKQASEERRRHRGTGLGLAIARRLVLAHGGSISVDSRVGEGSTFQCLLPLYKQSARAARRQANAGLK